MPLRDHFRPPLSDRRSWEGFHGGWPMMIVGELGRRLPGDYIAEPQVHLGSAIEIDVATYEGAEAGYPPAGRPDDEGGGVAVEVYAPPVPSVAIATDLGDLDEYEVRVYDTRRGRRLVAAVEIVSPAKKDRPEHRRVFLAKCVALLREGVCVAIVDLVTTRSANLYAELMGQIGLVDPSMGDDPPPLYAVAARLAGEGRARRLEAWAYTLAIGAALPTLPLWIAPGVAVPLELEASYEETCRVLRIP